MRELKQLLNLINRNDLLLIIHRMIITSQERTCLIEKLGNGHSAKDVAEIIGVDDKTVYKIIYRVKPKLVKDIKIYIKNKSNT